MTDLPPERDGDDLHQAFAALRRPRLLLRAARCGQNDYIRGHALRRLLRLQLVPTPAAAVARLLVIEAELERARLENAATYDLIRHIEVLIALMAEMRLLPPPADAVPVLPLAAE